MFSQSFRIKDSTAIFWDNFPLTWNEIRENQISKSLQILRPLKRINAFKRKYFLGNRTIIWEEYHKSHFFQFISLISRTLHFRCMMESRQFFIFYRNTQLFTWTQKFSVACSKIMNVFCRMCNFSYKWLCFTSFARRAANYSVNPCYFIIFFASSKQFKSFLQKIFASDSQNSNSWIAINSTTC